MDKLLMDSEQAEVWMKLKDKFKEEYE